MADVGSDTAHRAVSRAIQRSLQEGGAHSSRRATNAVFHDLTGVDPHTLSDILIRDAPVASKVGARHVRDRLADLLHTRRADASALLGASESRFSRNDNLDKDILDRTHAILDTYMNVAAALGPDGASEWFSRPNPALDNEPPLTLLKTAYGRKLVDDLVSALLAGSYT